jgi:acyl carrier protein
LSAKAEIRATVHAVVAEIFELEPQEMRDETRFEELAIDSVTWVELIVALERRFEVHLTVTHEIDRIGDLVELTERHVRG